MIAPVAFIHDVQEVLISPLMKKTVFYFSSFALAALLFTGCESNGIANRINEKSAVFTSLTPTQKQYLEEGMVYLGDTSDMAYIAFGKPSSIETKQKDGTTVEMWSYKTFYPSGRLEYTLTEYSRARNPHLNRSLDLKSGGSTVSDHAPGAGRSPGGGGIGSGTGTATGQSASPSLPEIPVYNLYVFFHENIITDIKLESRDGTVF